MALGDVRVPTGCLVLKRLSKDLAPIKEGIMTYMTAQIQKNMTEEEAEEGLHVVDVLLVYGKDGNWPPHYGLLLETKHGGERCDSGVDQMENQGESVEPETREKSSATG